MNSPTSLPTLKRGTEVVCTLSKFLPERISKRTGQKKPAENRTQVLSGRVLDDYGGKVYVTVRYPSGHTRQVTLFRYEVLTEEEYKKGLTV
jgi:hypothetical protein